MPLGTSEAWERLAKGSFRAVVTGDSSAGHYRVLSGQDKLTLYVDDLERASECLEVSIGPLFPNIELIEEQSVLFYFDARLQENIRWASPIQTWLELSHSGPREREAAQQLQPFLRKGEGAMLS